LFPQRAGGAKSDSAPRTSEFRGAGIRYVGRLKTRHDLMVAAMKRVLEWAFWAIGTVAIAYLALYLYASLTGRQFQPGDPIHIFRSPDAPDYS